MSASASAMTLFACRSRPARRVRCYADKPICRRPRPAHAYRKSRAPAERRHDVHASYMPPRARAPARKQVGRRNTRGARVVYAQRSNTQPSRIMVPAFEFAARQECRRRDIRERVIPEHHHDASIAFMPRARCEREERRTPRIVPLQAYAH